VKFGRRKHRLKSRFSGFFGVAAGRAWHGLLIASKIGVLKSVKEMRLHRRSFRE
jgi:hypothetical protein